MVLSWAYEQLLHLTYIYVYIGTIACEFNKVLPWFIPKRLYDAITALFEHDGDSWQAAFKLPMFGTGLQFVYSNYCKTLIY